VGYPEKFEVAIVGFIVVEIVEAIVEGFFLPAVIEFEGGDELEGEFGDDTEYTEGYLGGFEDVAVLGCGAFDDVAIRSDEA